MAGRSQAWPRRLQVCERRMGACCMWTGARLQKARVLIGAGDADAPPAEIVECPTCGGLLLYAAEEASAILFRLYREGRLPDGWGRAARDGRGA